MNEHDPGAAYPPGVPATHPAPSVPLTRLLDDAAQDFPDTDAIDLAGHRLTYREVLEHVDRLATVLADAGVAPGDRVATLLPTGPALLVTVFATWRLAAVCVVLEPDLEGEAIAEALERHRGRVVVADPAAYAHLAAHRGALPSVERVLVAAPAEFQPFPRNLRPAARWSPLRARRERAGRFKEAIRRTAAEVGQAPLPGEATAAIVGGVALSHDVLVAAAFALRLWVPDVRAGGETLLLAVPLWRPLGLAAALGLGVLAAATLALPSASAPEAALRGARRRRPTLLVGTAGLAGTLARVGGSLADLRVALVGGPVDEDEVARLHEVSGARLRGVLEGPAGPVAAHPVYGDARLGSCGHALTDVTLAALDADGRTLPVGGVGRLAAQGPSVPGAGWWPLGVGGHVDADGYAWLAEAHPHADSPSEPVPGAPAPGDPAPGEAAPGEAAPGEPALREPAPGASDPDPGGSGSGEPDRR